MRIFLSIFLYLMIVFSFMHGEPFLAVPAVILFSLHYGALSLIPLAILLDGYYGNFYSLPALSFAAVAWYAAVEHIRPKLIDPKLLHL